VSRGRDDKGRAQREQSEEPFHTLSSDLEDPARLRPLTTDRWLQETVPQCHRVSTAGQFVSERADGVERLPQPAQPDIRERRQRV
jgi:hypothetical protein